MNMQFVRRQPPIELDNYVAVGGPLEGTTMAMHKGTLRLVWGDPQTRRVYEYEVIDNKLEFVKEVKKWLRNWG